MKLVAIDMTPDKITLIYSDRENEEMVSYEFGVDDPDIEEKLKPHRGQPLLEKHLKRHPIMPRGTQGGMGVGDAVRG